MYLAYTHTHVPVDPYPDDYGKSGNGSFADVSAQADDDVCKVPDIVDDLGLKKNTIAIFASNNGREGVPGSFGFTGPWRRAMFSRTTESMTGSTGRDFFRGLTDESARESVAICTGNTLIGVKWRSWKLPLK